MSYRENAAAGPPGKTSSPPACVATRTKPTGCPSKRACAWPGLPRVRRGELSPPEVSPKPNAAHGPHTGLWIQEDRRQFRRSLKMVRAVRIELTSSAWKAEVLPLNDARIRSENTPRH